MEEKSLGKLGNVTFGAGGYDGAMTGFTFPLHGEKGSSVDFWGTWTSRSDSAKWTEQDRINTQGKYAVKVSNILTQAKKPSIDKLEGTPIEIVWINQNLYSWRILTEVL